MKKLLNVFLIVIVCSSVFGQYDWIVGEWEADVQGQTITANFKSNGSLTMKFGSNQPMSETYKVSSGSTIVLTSGNISYEISENRNNLDLNFDGNIVNLIRQEDKTSSESIAKTPGNTDWDKVLADYEAYTDKYIKLLKKYNEGDMSVMNDYLAMMEKAQKFQNSLMEADDDLTPAQMQKYLKISQKMLDAAMDLYGSY